MQEEQRLVRRLLDGEERAFTEFFDEYHACLYRFALPRLNGDVDAQPRRRSGLAFLDSFRGPDKWSPAIKLPPRAAVS